MYSITIRIPETKDPAIDAQNLEQHRAWFQKHQGKEFLFTAGFTDARAGIILTADMPYETLEEVLQEDVYFDDPAATYEVHELRVSYGAAQLNSAASS
ncbi:MAG: hypothetical protein Q3976_03555 [Corynebacterium sp.]|nr:hypothetical protein [Corynebacterium sp.]